MGILVDIFNPLNTNRLIFRTISDHLDYENPPVVVVVQGKVAVCPRSYKKHKYTVWTEIELLNMKPCSR